MKLSRRGLLLGFGVAVSTLTPNSHAQKLRTFSNGMDVSWLPDVEAAGGHFYTNKGQRINAIALLQKSGVKVGRMRIFVNPQTANGSIERAVALARRLKAYGLEICVDLHYSDTWADPANQEVPANWPSEIDLLEKQVGEYTRQTLNEFVQAGVSPQWVQLGNEIAGGFLWPLGKISTGTASEWQNFVRLQNAALQAMRSVLPNARSIVHLECGGDYQRVRWWLDNAQVFGLEDFDVVGLSYYSQWHGSLKNLSKTLDVVTSEFNLPAVIAETAYPWSPRRFGNDIIDTSKAALSGYALSPIGQKKYVTTLESLLRRQPANLGLGLWWWEGFARTVRTADGTVAWNGGMTNSTLVDISGKALPGLEALNGQ